MLMSMVGLQAFAGFNTSTKIQVGDLYYYLDNDNLQAEVTSMQSGKYAGDIVIPSSINYEAKTYSVTSIGSSAFEYCSGLTSVTIPNSVTSIGNYAFHGCNGLTSLTIPESVTSIRYQAFYGCSSLTSVTIPEGVTRIGDLAFRDCTSLTSVTIPNSVTSIGSQAFWGCSGLTSVTIPNSVTFIGSSAFSGCSGLTSVTIPNSVTSIEQYTFYNCSGLTSVNIPESVTSIGSSAFYGTKWFNDQPDGVVYAGNHAYRYKGTMPENTSITIKDGTKSICVGAFQNCISLTSVSIPNSVTSIGYNAFSGCSGLTSVTIPNSVTSIGSSAFSGCSGLTSVVIPNSVTSIGESTFSGCSGLTSVVIPSSVTKIDSEAFQGCTGLKDVYCYPTEVPETNGSAFNKVTAINVALHVPSSSSNKYRLHEVWGQFKLDSYIYLDETAFTYSVDGLSKMKMTIPATVHKLNITAEEGWKVVALTVNDESKMSELKDNVLTINISADTEVKVTFGWANEANLYTEDAVTGIATIEGEGVKVQAKDGQIWVDGAAGKTVRLYTIGGALMTTVTPKADMTGKFSVAAGTYIVQVGNKAAKVVVK